MSGGDYGVQLGRVRRLHEPGSFGGREATPCTRCRLVWLGTRRSMRWAVLGLAGASLVALVALVGCSGPAASEQPPVDLGVHFFGSWPPAAAPSGAPPIVKRVPLRTSGSGARRVVAIRESCRCAEATVEPERVGPNQEAVLTLSYWPSPTPGPDRFTIDLLFDDGSIERHAFFIRCYPRVAPVEPDDSARTVTVGEPVRLEIPVRLFAEEPSRLAELVEVSGIEGVRYHATSGEAHTVGDGVVARTVTVQIECPPFKTPGVHTAELTLTFQDPQSGRRFRAPVWRDVVVQPLLLVKPRRLVLSPGEQAEVVIRRRDGAPLRCRGLHIEPSATGVLAASVIQEGEQIRVQVAAGRPEPSASPQGTLREYRVVVSTDFDANPEAVIAVVVF